MTKVDFDRKGRKTVVLKGATQIINQKTPSNNSDPHGGGNGRRGSTSDLGQYYSSESNRNVRYSDYNPGGEIKIEHLRGTWMNSDGERLDVKGKSVLILMDTAEHSKVRSQVVTLRETHVSKSILDNNRIRTVEMSGWVAQPDMSDCARRIEWHFGSHGNAEASVGEVVVWERLA